MPKEIRIEDLPEFLNDTVKVTKHPQSEHVMREIVELTKEQLRIGFESGVSPDGARWPALKYPRPPGHNQNNKPLIDTETLMDSVTVDHEEHVEGVTSEALTLGTYVEYAGVHQEGSEDGNIPQRKFLGFNKKVKDHATEEVADDVIKQIDNL